jgi:Uma2 family endonuclease
MAVPTTLMTLEEFLAWENEQPDRNEFHRGEVFAMVGARRAHGRVVSNLNRRFSEALDGSPNQVFAEGMKVQIGTDTILYPDICRIDSLQQYVLVDPDTRRIEVFRRGADGLWDLHDQSDDESLVAASIGCTVRMVDVFAGIDAA